MLIWPAEHFRERLELSKQNASRKNLKPQMHTDAHRCAPASHRTAPTSGFLSVCISVHLWLISTYDFRVA